MRYVIIAIVVAFAIPQISFADEQDAQNITRCKAAVAASDYPAISKYCRLAAEAWSVLADNSHGDDRAEDLYLEGMTLAPLAMADGILGDRIQMHNELQSARQVLREVIQEGHDRQAMRDAQAELNSLSQYTF